MLRGLRRAGQTPRHGRQIQADQAVRAAHAAHQPHAADAQHPRPSQEGSVTTSDLQGQSDNHFIVRRDEAFPVALNWVLIV